MAIIKYGNDYMVKSYGSSRNNSGPSGKRKTRPFRVFRANLADAAQKYGIVLSCNDQHKNLGTGNRDKWDSFQSEQRRLALEAAKRAFT